MAKRNILNLRELVRGAGNQLRYVHRFSSCRRTLNESVAEHSFFTAFFSLMVGCFALAGGDEVDVKDIVLRALLHDIEEQFTGDVIRPVKYSTPAVKLAIDRMGETLVSSFLEKLTDEEIIRQRIFHIWNNAKDDTLNGRVVAFADFLSVLAYLYQEVDGGNRMILRNVDGLRAHMNTFHKDEYRFLKPLVDEAEDLTQGLLKIKAAV